MPRKSPSQSARAVRSAQLHKVEAGYRQRAADLDAYRKRADASRRGWESRRARAEVEAQFARLFANVERGERARGRSVWRRRAQDIAHANYDRLVRQNEAARQRYIDRRARSEAARRGWQTRRARAAERAEVAAQTEAYRRMVERDDARAAARGWYGRTAPEPTPTARQAEREIVGPDWVDKGADYFTLTDLNRSEVTPDTHLTIDAGTLYQYDGPALAFAAPELRNEFDAAALESIEDAAGYWRLAPIFTIERNLTPGRDAWAALRVTVAPDWLERVTGPPDSTPAEAPGKA